MSNKQQGKGKVLFSKKETKGTQVEQKVFTPSEITTVEAAQEANAKIDELLAPSTPEQAEIVEAAKEGRKTVELTIPLRAEDRVSRLDNPRTLLVKKVRPEAPLPTVAHPGEDLGYDLYSYVTVRIPPHTSAVIDTGIAAHQQGHGLILKDRSSMAAKGLHVVGGVIDAGYRGELSVVLHNSRFDTYEIKEGDKIAQAIPYPVLTGAVWEVPELPEAERGDKGFGSTGR